MDIELMSVRFYQEVDPRRKQERADARMISEDHSSVANLSQQPIYKQFDPNRHMERFNLFDADQR